VDGAFAASFAGFTAALYTSRVKDMEASLATLAPAQAVRLRVQEGVLHALFGRAADAEAAFRGAMKQDPSLVSPYVNLANLRLISRDPDGALAIVKQGLARNRDSALLNLVAARIYADKGDQKDASVYLAVVRKASPDLADRYESEAGGAARAGNADEVPSVVWGADQ
jgi:predicted Zn-dependent protease